MSALVAAGLVLGLLPSVGVQLAAMTPALASSSYAAAVQADGPVAYWRLDDTGTTAADSSGNGWNGTLHGGISTGIAGPTNDGDTAMSFDGTGYISTAYVQTSVVQYSEEVWIKTTSNNALMLPVQDRGSDFTGMSISLWMGATGGGHGGPGRISYELDSNNLEVGQTTTRAYNDGFWHHVVGVWTGSSGVQVATSQFVIYVDGSVAASTASLVANVPVPSAPLTGKDGTVLGARNNATGTYTGVLDDVAIYTHALTAAQVSAHYQAAGPQVTGSFASPSNTTLACCVGGPPHYPQATALADVNRDGNLDYLLANSLTATLDVYLGHGDGTFGSRVAYAAAGQPLGLALGDLNGDGFTDVVVADGGANGYPYYTVFLGKGDGTFAAGSTYSISGNVNAVSLGDLSGDGKLDLVISTTQSQFAVLFGNGDGTFGTATFYAIHGSGSTTTLADVNGDKRLDVLVAELSPPGADRATFAVFLNTGNGTLGARQGYQIGNTYQGAINIAAGDLNNDGIPDLAVSNEAYTEIFRGTGGGGFSDAGPVNDADTVQDALVDVNGDGNLDLVSVNYGPNYPRISVHGGLGDGTFAAGDDYVPPATNSTWRTFAFGDLNHDGKPDVVTVSAGNNNTGVNPIRTVFLNITAGPFMPIGGRVPPSEVFGGGNPCHACWARRFVHNAWADPVDSQTGNFTEEYGDLMIPGRGTPLAFVRSYNSLAASSNGPLGYGWTQSYNATLAQDGTTGRITITQENGSQVSFTKTGTSTPAYYAPTAPRTIATLVQNADGSWTFTRQADETLRFSSAGRLVSITDRNGYATTLGYNGSNQLSSITDPANRSLTLAYTGGLLTSVTDPVGRVVQYGYNDGLGNLTDVTDVNGGNTHYTYDAGHRLLTVRDPRGNTVTTNHYDANGRVDYQLDALQRQTTFTYAADGSSTVITDPVGNATKETFAFGVRLSVTRGYGTAQAATWTYTYDPFTLSVIGITDPNGHSTYRTYDASGNMLTSSDGLGRTTSYSYNAFNEPVTVTDAKGVTTTMTYDANGNLLTTSTPLVGSSPAQSSVISNTYGDAAHPGDVTAITDADGKSWLRSYDTYGDLVGSTDPLGDTTTYTYNTVGWLLTSTAPRGNVAGGNPAQFTTTYSYADPVNGAVDQFGDVRVVTDPIGHAVTTGYDADRNVVSVKDAAGNVTTTTYDAAGQKTDVHRADSTTLHTDYNPDGTVLHQVDGAGNTTTYGYDALAHVTSVTDPLLRVTRYAYDAVGNLLTKQDPVPGATCTETPKVGCTTYGYDAANELTSITYSDGTTPNVTIGYDADGQRQAMSDGIGSSSWTWDSLHRLTTSVNGAGTSVGYGYDLVGRVTSITYPGSHVVTRGYDDAGRLTSVGDWLGHTTTFTPDPDSNTTAEIYPNSTTATMAYDNADRLTSISDAPTATPSSPFASFSYGRDNNGQVSSVASTGVPTDTHAYGYTPLNQVQNVDSASYGYSAADTITQLTDGTLLNYDAADQLTASGRSTITVVGTASGGDVGTTTSLAISLPAGIQANDQILVATTQQAGQSVTAPSGYTQVASATSTGTPAASTFVYRKTAGGGESQVTLGYGVGVAKSVVVIVYRGVDPSAPIDVQSSGNAAAATSVTAGSVTPTLPYDRLTFFGGAAGNLLPASWTAPTGMSSEVQKSDQATTSAAVFDQTLTAAGASGSRSASVSTSAQLNAIMLALKPLRTSYTYDSRGNRTSTTPAGGSTTTYSYDQANRLVAYGSTATYRYNGDGLRMSKTVNGTAENFTWDVSGSLPLLLVDASASSTSYFIYGENGSPIEQISSAGAVYYLQQDQLQSTRVLTDASGSVAATWSYDAYGNVSASTGSATTPFLFAGQYRDAESSFVYLRARYYDSLTAQFFTRDPAESLTRKPYGYAGENPLNATDPSGMFCWPPWSSNCEVDLPGGNCLANGAPSCSHGDTGVANLEDNISDPNPTEFVAFVRDASAVTAAWSDIDRTASGAGNVSFWDWAAIPLGLLPGAGYASGREIECGENLRISPLGNWGAKTGAGEANWAARLPHYHRRITDPITGETVPGGSMKRHRPWQGW